METRTWRMYNEGFLTQEPIVDIIAKHLCQTILFTDKQCSFFWQLNWHRKTQRYKYLSLPMITVSTLFLNKGANKENRAITNLLVANKYETEKPSKYFEKWLLYGETPLTCSYFPHILIFFATYLERKKLPYKWKIIATYMEHIWNRFTSYLYHGFCCQTKGILQSTILGGGALLQILHQLLILCEQHWEEQPPWDLSFRWVFQSILDERSCWFYVRNPVDGWEEPSWNHSLCL